MVETLERALSVRWGECRSGAVKDRADEGRRYARVNALLLSRPVTDVPQRTETVPTTRKTYYPGLVLLRIAAAIGVIQIHTGAQSGPWVDGFRALMIQERVPVFMLMALFLTVERQVEGITLEKVFRRLRQLVLPLIVWMLIYDGSNLIRHGIQGHWQAALAPFANPVDQFLGKGWHLYFLAWLAVGTVVAYFLTAFSLCLTLRFRLPKWLGPALVGAITLAASCALGHLNTPVELIVRVPADGPWFSTQCNKLVSGIGGYLLSAVPYVAIALMIRAVRLTSIRVTARQFMVLGIGALVLNLVVVQWGNVFPQLTLWVGAVCGLVFGLSIPTGAKFPAWVSSAARASFGIYLSHKIILECYERIWTRISGQPDDQLDFGPFVAVVLLTFLTSWFLTVRLQRFTFTRRVLLGAN